jgi:hypothetical protein
MILPAHSDFSLEQSALKDAEAKKAAALDAKLVDFDTPLQLRQNWHVIAGILAANAAITILLLYFWK